MARQKLQTEQAPRKRAAPVRAPKAKPWWDGLSDTAVRELLRRGYRSRDDAMRLSYCLSQKPRRWAVATAGAVRWQSPFLK